MQITGAVLESLWFTPPSSARECPALAVKEAQSPPSQMSLDNKDLTFPIRHICNLAFQYWQQCTLDDTRALRKQICGGPLAPGTFCECETGRMESWRPSRASGPFSGGSVSRCLGWCPSPEQGRVVYSSSSLALVQASLLSTVGCISLRVLLVWVVFVFRFVLTVFSEPRISMNDYWGVYKE